MSTKKSVSQTVASDTKSKKSSALTEEVIRKKAHEIYLERVRKGIHGSAENDWQKAMNELQRRN